MLENTKLNNTDRTIIALAVIALIFSFTSRFDFNYTRLFGGVWNFGHVVAFYIWTYLCLRFIKPLRALSFIVQFLVLLFIALVFGLFIEFMQTLVGRDADMGDVVSDLTGTSLAVLIHSNKKNTVLKSLRVPLIILIVSGTLFQHKKIVLYPVNDYYTYQNFPILIDPSLPFESTKFETKKIHSFKKILIDSKSYFKVVFSKAEYSTLFMGFFPLDWEDYDEVKIKVFNPSDKALSIYCRVHDLPHLNNKYDNNDRFSRAIEIQPGNSIINLSIDDIYNAPATRKMDLTKMAAIGFFTNYAKELNELHIYGAELVKH